MTIDVITAPIVAASCSLPDILKDYQTLIGAILGFPGIMYTLYKNNENQLRLHASQKKHDLELEANRMAQEANSLRVALKSELTFNRDGFETSVLQFHEGTETTQALYPNAPKDVIYNTLLERIGLLSETEVEKVLRAYRLINQLPFRLRILVGADNIGGLNNEYLVIGPESRKAAAEMHESFIPSINAAIKTLDEHLEGGK
ncbi:MAG: hypothetical protein JAY63_13070 [Candidatus Thiodiazotropha taylori]|nr:hypothetical protein [Candidatus Thiodiazotropha taylori]